MIKALVWDDGAAGYFETGAPGREKTTLGELSACPHYAGKGKRELEEIHAEKEIEIMEADCERLGALRWLALLNDGAVNVAPEKDGFEGCTEDELLDCTFMDGMSQQALEGIVDRAEATIREAANQRVSALRRLARVSQRRRAMPENQGKE